MVLGIICFALEMVFLAVAYGLGYNLSYGFSIFTIIIFVLCTIGAAIGIFLNVKTIKEGVYKGKGITGLVFSCVALTFGLIFDITLIAMLI